MLLNLPTYKTINEDQLVPVTAARKFVRENEIKGPALIEVRRNQFTVDRFYWCKKGMFSAAYAESNYSNFVELKEIANKLINKEKIYNIADLRKDVEVEKFNMEYIYA